MERLAVVVAMLWCWGQSSPGALAAGCTSRYNSTCGQLCYTGGNGSITLPTVCGGNYCNNMHCQYRVCPASASGHVFVDIPRMDVESCRYDYVVIKGTRICEAFSESRKYLLDVNGCLNVTFLSDHSVTRSGFTMLYSTYPICNESYIADTAEVSLPTICEGRYCPNMTCHIDICPLSDPGHVTLTFSLFDVDDNDTCSGDVLEIGGSAYCRMDSVPRVFALDQSGCLQLTFRSDASQEGRGFNLSYQAGVEASCLAVYVGAQGVVVPPVPCPDPTSPSSSCGPRNCSLQVCLGPQARWVSLTARQWNLSCPGDYMQAGGRDYCEVSPRGEVLALDGGGCLDLLFHWDGPGGGVQLFYSLYSPECGVGDLVGDWGQLSVPTTCQGRYCDNLTCSYRLCASSASSSLVLSLLMVDIMDPFCSGDYLTIGSSQSRYCSLATQPPRMDVDRWGCVAAGFHSDSHGGGQGFVLSYSAYSSTCGVLGYSADHGIITLPANCGGKYCPDLSCTYTVCPESRSTHVQLQTRTFRTVSSNCSDAFLQIDETRICEFDPQSRLFAVDAQGCLSMTFWSDSQGGSLGFQLEYAAVSPPDEVTEERAKQRASSPAVIAVVSSLSAVIVVLIVALVIVSVMLCHSKRRSRPPAASCLSDVKYENEVAKPQTNDYAKPTPASDRMEESNYTEPIPASGPAQENEYEPMDMYMNC